MCVRHNNAFYLREQNRGSSLLSPQSFILSQNLFAGTHFPLVHEYSASVHLDAAPRWPPSFDLSAAAVPNTLIDSRSILVSLSVSFRCAIVVVVGAAGNADVTELVLMIIDAVAKLPSDVLLSAVVCFCPSIPTTVELLVKNIICCATIIWTINLKANGHHGADELFIITVRRKKKKKKENDKREQQKIYALFFFYFSCVKKNKQNRCGGNVHVLKCVRKTWCDVSEQKGVLNWIKKELPKKNMRKPCVHFNEIIYVFFFSSMKILSISHHRSGMA